MKTILIVDDIFENLYLLRVIFETAGYLVIEANDGKDGLEKLRENNIDLIVSDILMPVMDGYMFCQACKKDKSYKDIPFVFYTSTYTEKLDEDFALKLGAAHFLRKPTDQDEILSVIQEILKQAKPQAKPAKKVRFTEQEVLKLYSKRLISKLEEKNIDLEAEILERQKAQLALTNENEILDLIAKNTSLNKIFDYILLSYESFHPEYYGAINILQEDGINLELVSAPSMPKSYNLAMKCVAIGENIGSCGTAAFTKKPVIVSDISTDNLWVDYKAIALKHNLKSCWSIPILSAYKTALGTFAIYSNTINTPTLEDIRELNSAVRLASLAITKSNSIKEIKKREESYTSLVEQASDPIVKYTLDGTIYSFNKAAASSLMYTKKEFSKLKIQDCIVGDLIESSNNEKALLEGKPVLFDRQLRRKDGTLIEVEISAKLQKDGKILGIIRDITEWQKKLKEIKLAKEFSSGLLKSMNEGLVVLNLDSEIISVNPSFCEMIGFTEKELIGVKRPFPWSPPELQKENDKHYELLIQDKNLGDYENIYMRKNGTRFPVHVLISSIYDENGVKTANFSTIQDITKRKKAEEDAILASKQLTLANIELNKLRNQLEQENIYLRNELDLVFNYEEMVYGSEEFSNVLSEVEKVAPTTATVLLLGESGTGKELLARAIHKTSLRNNKPLIKVNCSAIPRELIESELFGHKKGSFTGAFNDKIGKLELADRGTLFLDEIGELPLDMQPKILRFLQEGEIEVVGGTVSKKLDVRVIAATNRNLKEEIEKKQFREDLYFRLNVFPIVVPPLRKRKDDIPLLVQHFVDKFNKSYGKNIKYISDGAMRKLKQYEWPGNIRELENLVERASILSTSETLIIPGFESSTQKTVSINNTDLSFDTAQRNHILQVLDKCDWKISGTNGASTLLELKPSTLRDKMVKLGIKK